MPLIIRRDAHSLQQTVCQPLQGLVAVDGVQEALRRSVGNGLQLLSVGLSHPDAKHYDSLLPQAHCRRRHIICGVPICYDHGDLRHPINGSASCLFGEKLGQEKVDGFARFCASRTIWKFFYCTQQGALVHVILQQELLVRFIAVLSQADPNFVRADVEACDDALEKLTHLLKVINADAGGAIDQEDDVSH